MTITLKQNDTFDKVYLRAVYRNGLVADLTGATVYFKMETTNKQLLINSQATVLDAANGEMEYEFVEGDTYVIGTHRAEFLTIFPDGKQKTFPDDGYLQVTIVDDIDGDRGTYIEEIVAVRVSLIEEFKEGILEDNETFKANLTQQQNTFEDNATTLLNQTEAARDTAIQATNNAVQATNDAITATNNAIQATSNANQAATNVQTKLNELDNEMFTLGNYKLEYNPNTNSLDFKLIG